MRSPPSGVPDRPVPQQVQKTFDQTHSEVTNIMRQEFSWDKLEPMYVRIYQKTFTQAEMDNLLAFYKTPGGQALINKMPLVMQNTMAEVQQMMTPLMQRIQRMQQDMVAQMQTEKGKKSQNDRLVAVAVRSFEYKDVKSISGLNESLVQQMTEFLALYNKNSGKEDEVKGVDGPEQAMELLAQAIKKFQHKLKT